jgi:hypothetical protein
MEAPTTSPLSPSHTRRMLRAPPSPGRWVPESQEPAAPKRSCRHRIDHCSHRRSHPQSHAAPNYSTTTSESSQGGQGSGDHHSAARRNAAAAAAQTPDLATHAWEWASWSCRCGLVTGSRGDGGGGKSARATPVPPPPEAAPPPPS